MKLIDSVYGLDLTPDQKLVKIRDRKVAKCIKEMGDKYLLAKPVQRKK